LRKREVKAAEKEYRRVRAQAFFINEPEISEDEVEGQDEMKQ